MAARSANKCQCLSLLVSCASTPTKMITPNNILPVCDPFPTLNQIKPGSQFCELTPPLTVLFSLTVSSKMSSQGLRCFLIMVLHLDFTVWQNQVMGIVWNPVIGYVKDIGEKVRQCWTSSVLEPSNNITVNSPFKSVSSEVFDGESRSQITSQVTERFGQWLFLYFRLCLYIFFCLAVMNDL